jgi:succinate dehydrogenase/fumarate reductase flavoprotein subunit
MELTRRDLVKFGGASCLVASSAAIAAPALADEAGAGHVVGTADVNFTQEADILIVGTGLAGLAAGMEPALAGKKIIFAEKKGSFGGDSASSCWFMFASGSKPQLDAGLETTIDQAWESVAETQTAGWDQYEWFADWAKGKYYANTKFVDCGIENFGCSFQEPASAEELPRLSASVILPAEGIGTGYSYVLSPIQAKLEELGCEFEYEMRAIALIKDAPEGAVIGCRFQDADGNYVDIKAGSVVLATGGFVDNGEMVNEYLPEWANMGVLVHGSMGEGHKMAAAAGAQVDGMDTSFTYCNLMGDIPNATTWGYWAPLVLVLPNGKRFIQEGQSHDAAAAAMEAGYREWWVIFDQQAFDARCIAKSVENNVNIHADAYRTADTLEELAAAMDVPAETLVATFEEYDGYVQAGEDAAFGKTSWLNSLSAPYHALKLNAMRYKTSGGLMVGPNNQVLNTEGEEIEGLYACGALTTLSYASCSTVAATGYYVGETLAAK